LQRGAFVTLSERGALRGCIGHIPGDRALGAVVRDMVVAAARDDPRFAPVEPEELPFLTLEISVLSEPAPLPAPVHSSTIVIGRDGLIVRREQRVGLLLPQVAAEYDWGPEAFLAAACRKAGLPPTAWQEPGVGRGRGKGERGPVIPRIVATPIAPLALPAPTLAPRRVAPEVIAAALPGPARDRLAAGEVLVVTTGQQPGLFTGPLYAVYKALSAIALARRLERERRLPVVPVFWVAGDDHDFAEANHTSFLDANGELARIVLRERAPDAALVPLAREPCGPEIVAALTRLRDGTPDTEFKSGVLEWLERSYRPEASLADAFAAALEALLGPQGGLVVLRVHDRAAKRAAAPWVLKGLDVVLPDGHTPVLIEARLGRDRLRPEGRDFVTRRSGERFTRAELERVAATEPERLSPNVLLRPAVEAALLPTVAYAAGPAELKYLPDVEPLYASLGVTRQAPVPRWSGVLVEARLDKLMERHELDLEAFDGKPGELEGRLVRHELPPDAVETLTALRDGLEQHYGRLLAAAVRIDPTLERTVESARNAAMAGAQTIEKKLVASLKRLEGETLVRQIGRARAALYPDGQPQERVLTIASFLVRYGPALLDGLEQQVARWAGVP
jgi:AmmeMemoRadiSam system protein A